MPKLQRDMNTATSEVDTAGPEQVAARSLREAEVESSDVALSWSEREALNVAVDEAETCACCGDDYGSRHIYAAVERIVADRGAPARSLLRDLEKGSRSDQHYAKKLSGALAAGLEPTRRFTS